MKLKKWMDINNLSFAQMAQILTDLRLSYGLESQVNKSMIYNWVAGRYKPRLDNIKLIKIATQGRVSFNDF